MKIVEIKYLLIALILALVLLTGPYLVRMLEGNPYTINSDTYYGLRLESMQATYHDPLQQRDLPLNILYFLHLPQANMFLISKIIALILGLASVALGYVILKNFNMNEKNIAAILLLLVASPIFIYTFIDFNTYAIIILLNLLIIFFLMKNKLYASTLLFLILPFIDIYGAIISFLFIMLFIVSANKNLKSHRAFIIISILAIIISIIINSMLGYNILGITPFEKSNIITDIGADIGFSFSSIILSIIGLLLLWEKGWKNLVIYSVIILFIILSVFSTFLRIYLNFLLAIYAGFAFIYLTRRKWSINIIKKITILLIICSILFTTLVYTTKIIKEPPNPDYADALAFLNQQSFADEHVLSSADNGYLIEYFSQRAAFIDPKTYNFENARMQVFENISTSRNLDRTEAMLKEYSIKYIFIDQDYMQYLEEKQGLLFLINTSNKFKNIYKNPGMEIWMYVQ